MSTVTERPVGTPTFSICIPNYNYERYLGQTIDSVLRQEGDFEIVVSDNASTDASLDVIPHDERIRVFVNRRNVGFAGNLDRAVSRAQGEHVILLSSDDLILPRALATYGDALRALGEGAAGTVLVSSIDLIDSEGRLLGRGHPPQWLWHQEDRAPDLEAALECPVYRLPSSVALGRGLERLRNPFYFATTCYPRSLWEEVEGYGGDRLINPDKGFHWRLLHRAKQAVFIDRPLFQYRIHDANQGAIQHKMGILKHLVDEYSYTFQLEEDLLAVAGLDRPRIIRAFVEHDIALRGLDAYVRGDSSFARRSVRFGQATYPTETRRNWKVLGLRLLLLTGPIGRALLKPFRNSMRNRLLGPPQRSYGSSGLD